MTSTAAMTPLHNRWVLMALATGSGRRMMPGLCGLRFTGRRTGLAVTLPVAFTAGGSDVMVLVGHAATKQWWRNFRGGYPAELLIDGRWLPARGEVVDCDRLEYPRLLAAYRHTHSHVSADTTEPIIHFVVTDSLLHSTPA